MKTRLSSKDRCPYREQFANIHSIWTSPKPVTEEVFLVQKCFQSFLCLGLCLTPGMFVRTIGWFWGRKLQKQTVEIYAVLKAVTFVVILFSWLSKELFVAVLAAWCIADLFLNLLGFVLLRHYWNPPASLTRSLILLGVNFVEYCAAFAIIYLQCGLLKFEGDIVKSGIVAMYYSIITAATVGYGDVSPANDMGRVVAMIQILASFLFLAVVVASFVAQLPTGLTGTDGEE